MKLLAVRCIACVSVCCASVFLNGPLTAAEPLLAGTAQVDITPPNGFPMAGYYHERLATGAQDPLHAKALVLQQGDQRAAIVACDLTGIAMDLTNAVRARAAEATGIPAEHIVLTGSHSHTAPDYTKDLYHYLADPSTPENQQRYAAKLIDGIASAVITAHKELRPVNAGIGSAQQEVPIAFNRRFIMRDGSARTWMNFADPNVVRSAGPIDPQVGVLLLREADSTRPLIAVSNFALHLDTLGGTRWSADYPYYVEKFVGQSLGPDVVSFFGLGCCGDINHVDPNRAERNKTQFIGESLAATVGEALAAVQPIESPELRVRSTVVKVPLRSVSDMDLERAPAVLKAAKEGAKVEFFEQVSAYRDVILEGLRNPKPRVATDELLGVGLSHTWQGIGDELPVEVTTITLGNDLAVVCLPGEVFVDLGLAIKQASPFKQTMVFELSNCVETLYIPTRAAYAQGSYEVTNSMLEAGAGEMLVEGALKLLRESASSLVTAQ